MAVLPVHPNSRQPAPGLHVANYCITGFSSGQGKRAESLADTSTVLGLPGVIQPAMCDTSTSHMGRAELSSQTVSVSKEISPVYQLGDLGPAS